MNQFITFSLGVTGFLGGGGHPEGQEGQEPALQRPYFNGRGHPVLGAGGGKVALGGRIGQSRAHFSGGQGALKGHQVSFGPPGPRYPWQLRPVYLFIDLILT